MTLGVNRTRHTLCEWLQNDWQSDRRFSRGVLTTKEMF
jgi:hypothetical protein